MKRIFCIMFVCMLLFGCSNKASVYSSHAFEPVRVDGSMSYYPLSVNGGMVFVPVPKDFNVYYDFSHSVSRNEFFTYNIVTGKLDNAEVEELNSYKRMINNTQYISFDYANQLDTEFSSTMVSALKDMTIEKDESVLGLEMLLSTNIPDSKMLIKDSVDCSALECSPGTVKSWSTVDGYAISELALGSYDNVIYDFDVVMHNLFYTDYEEVYIGNNFRYVKVQDVVSICIRNEQNTTYRITLVGKDAITLFKNKAISLCKKLDT